MINKLSAECFTNAVSKGFYDKQTRIEQLIAEAEAGGELTEAVAKDLLIHVRTTWNLSRMALIVTEVAEACEAIRKPHLMSDHVTGMKLLDEELADQVIRILDYAGYRGIDLEAAIKAKMAFNSNREHMHGGKLA